MRNVAEAADCTPAQAAIAWMLSRPGVTAPVLGASQPDQLTATIQAVDLKLGREALTRLSEASALIPEFGDVEGMASIGPVVFGGCKVQGWREQTVGK